MYVLLIRNIKVNKNKVFVYEIKNLTLGKLEGNYNNIVINIIMQVSIKGWL